MERAPQQLMEEIRRREDVILFIDDYGAGSAGDGNMDAGNILKPALARGDQVPVGATTLTNTEYQSDAALERRCIPLRLTNLSSGRNQHWSSKAFKIRD